MCEHSKQIIHGLLRNMRSMEEELKLQRAGKKKLQFWVGICLRVMLCVFVYGFWKPKNRVGKNPKLELM